MGARGGRLLSFHNGLKLKLFPRCFPAVSSLFPVDTVCYEMRRIHIMFDEFGCLSSIIKTAFHATAEVRVAGIS